MELKEHEAKIFQLKVDPETDKKTMCLEIELTDLDFNEIKEHWVDHDSLNIKIL